MTRSQAGRRPRLLLVGAFAYPHHQGSQIYLQEQAIALRSAGAEVELLTYGPVRPDASGSSARGPDRPEEGEGPSDPDRWRALDGFDHRGLPRWLAPRSARSGPRLEKPIADLALSWALRQRLGQTDCPDASWVASKNMTRFFRRSASNPATRASSEQTAHSRRARGGYDAILAHHAEAAGAALLTRSARLGRTPPIIYCAHTLLEQELPTYWNPRPIQSDGAISGALDGGPHGRTARPHPAASSPASPAARRHAERLLASSGRVMDAWLARHADAWIALTPAAERVMRASNGRPGRLIPPPIPQPRLDAAEVDALLRRLGLRPRGFFLYVGNLDPYQDLPLLFETARLLESARREPGRRGYGGRAADAGIDARAAAEGLPIVIATHAGTGGGARPARRATGAGAGARAVKGRENENEMASAGTMANGRVRIVPIGGVADAQALVASARATVVPRLGRGGFPIKLANSLAAGTPVVAFHGDEWGLVDGRDGLICADPSDPAGSLALALARLAQDAALAERLGRGAHATWRRRHAPQQVAHETLALIESLRR